MDHGRVCGLFTNPNNGKNDCSFLISKIFSSLISSFQRHEKGLQQLFIGENLIQKQNVF